MRRVVTAFILALATSWPGAAAAEDVFDNRHFDPSVPDVRPVYRTPSDPIGSGTGPARNEVLPSASQKGTVSPYSSPDGAYFGSGYSPGNQVQYDSPPGVYDPLYPDPAGSQ